VIIQVPNPIIIMNVLVYKWELRGFLVVWGFFLSYALYINLALPDEYTLL